MQNRLTTQLLLATQDLLTRFINLTETVNRKLIATQRLTSSLDILALLILGILVISNIVFLQRSVVKPVLQLHEAAEIIGAGNLDHKVGIATPDEIGQLSQAFDRMTDNLQQRTGELQETVAQLKEEMSERQQAEQQAASRGRLYRLLSRVNEAIVRAQDQEGLFRQACRIMMEEGDFLLCWIGRVDREAGLVRAAAQYDLVDDYTQNITVSWQMSRRAGVPRAWRCGRGAGMCVWMLPPTPAWPPGGNWRWPGVSGPPPLFPCSWAAGSKES